MAAGVRRRGRHDTLTLLPAGDAGREPIAPEARRAAERALVVLPASGGLLTGGRAVLFVVGALGHPGIAGLLERRPFVWAVEIAYRLVASQRARISRVIHD